MSEVVWRRERFSDAIEEMKPLFPKHHTELALYQGDVPLDPDYEMYRRIDDAGAMLFVIGRVDEQIVGYAVYFVRPHHHYSSTCWAVSDLYWLHPDYRRYGHGRAMFGFVEEELKKMGVSVMHSTFKVEHPAAGMLLASMGHALVEQGYSKKLS